MAEAGSIKAAVRRNIIPLIVATALFMANLDATVIATSLPAIAADFDQSPINLKLALTSYLLALAVFIPASGWMADRFGSRNVFRAAIIVFALGSVACAMATGLATLVAARVLQGIGGAMMVPVGRLLIWRTVPRDEIIAATAWLTIPALVGPVLGPLLGGFITTYLDWRWIFWINIPIAALGVLLASRFVPDIHEGEAGRFDLKGFLLVGPGLSLSLTAVTLAGLDFAATHVVMTLLVAGAALLMLYVRHALADTAPILDVRLLNIPTFRSAFIGGFLFRIGIGATPFLLPLLLQVGFGLTPFQSGLLTFVTGVGAMFMKTMAARILRRFGYRRVLISNAIFAAILGAVPALFTAATPALIMLVIFFVGGLARSLQFTSINTIAYADVPKLELSRATSLAAVGQELSGAVGVAFAALGLEAMMRVTGGTLSTVDLYGPVFVAIAIVSASSVLAFARLSQDAGDDLLRKPERADRRAAASPSPEDASVM